MSVTYNPNTPWPIPVLAKFVEVRECRGYHEIFKNGFVRKHPFETKLSDMGSIKRDWICRVFMLRADMTTTGAMHLIFDPKYYGKVQFSDTEDIYSLQNNNGAQRNEVLVSNVKVGDIFSIGLRINRHRDLVGLANDVEGPWIGQSGRIDSSKYQFKIWQGNHVLLSMHITQENIPQDSDQIYYPPDYIYPEYSEKPPGSSLIAWLSLENTDDDLDFGVENNSKKRIYTLWQKAGVGGAR
ncbi:hypothetical protein MTO96_027539 [Rhipicephalus appendiculatus]